MPPFQTSISSGLRKLSGGTRVGDDVIFWTHSDFVGRDKPSKVIVIGR